MQVLHTLSIFLHNYGHLDGVLSKFNETFKFWKRTTPILHAEGLLMFSFLQSGTNAHDNEIEVFLEKHLKHLDENPFFYGAIVSAFALRCGQNAKIRSVIQQTPHPEKCVQSMTSLILEYEGTSFRNVSFNSCQLSVKVIYDLILILETWTRIHHFQMYLRSRGNYPVTVRKGKFWK